MESLEDKASRSLTPVYFTSREICLPLEIIYHLSHFTKLDDFRNLIGAMWPNGEENDTFEERLWQLSLGKFRATFFNKKEVEVEYSYDRERHPLERVQIKLTESLLPLFGGVVPPNADEFVNPFAMRSFVYKNVNLHLCEGGMFSPCRHPELRYAGYDSDEYDSDEERASDDEEGITCQHNHFHHYCPKHVFWWFKRYLSAAIARQRGINDYKTMISITCLTLFEINSDCGASNLSFLLEYTRRRPCGFWHSDAI